MKIIEVLLMILACTATIALFCLMGLWIYMIAGCILVL